MLADFEDVKVKEPVISVDDKRSLWRMHESVSLKDGKFCFSIL